MRQRTYWSTRVFSFALMALLLAAVLPVHVPAAVAAASIQLSRSTAAPGDEVAVRGSGFTASDDIVITVDLWVGGSVHHVSTTTRTNTVGAFSGTLQIPGGTAQGTYTVTARDFHSHVATQSLTVLPLALVQVGKNPQTTTIVGNHPFYVSGTGFRSNEAVKLSIPFALYNGNVVVINKTVQADRNGAFTEVPFSIPSGTRQATIDLTAVGQQSGRRASARLAVTYHPYLALGATTIRPGEAVTVTGRDFVPSSNVVVSITFRRTDNTTVTLSRTVSANSAGDFATSLPLPTDIRLGTYGITATDTSGGVRASAQVAVAVHPVLSVSPTSVLPGETVTVFGSGFGAGERVSVSAAFRITSGGTQTAATTTTTGGTGGFSTRLTVPVNASSGAVSITAATPSGRATAGLQVRPRPTPTATATPTPSPTPTPTATPTPTSTPIPPTPRPKATLHFSYISVRHHTVRVGATNQVVVHASPRRRHAIWVHVWFPNGRHLDYYQNTSPRGNWSLTFKVPRGVMTKYSRTVTVTFRLWQGKHSVRTFRQFGLIS